MGPRPAATVAEATVVAVTAEEAHPEAAAAEATAVAEAEVAGKVQLLKRLENEKII